MSTSEPRPRRPDRDYLYTVHHVPGNDSLPRIPKTTYMVPQWRHIYATFAIDDGESKICDLNQGSRIDFVVRGASTLRIRLYAKRNNDDDECVASKDCGLDWLVSSDDPNSIVLDRLRQDLEDEPRLTLKVSVQHAGDVDAKLLAAPLSISERWKTMARHVTRLVNAGAVAAELDPRSKAVLALLNIGAQELGKRLTYHEDTLSLIDETGEASRITVDCDEPEFEVQRVKQKEARNALVLQVYCVLSFVHNLYSARFGRWSTKTHERVQELRKTLQTYIHQVETRGHHDTQTAVFRTEKLTVNLVNQGILDHLPHAKDVHAGSTKSCLDGTRTVLLGEIEDWAVHPETQRALILHGAAGKGKSAVAHSVAMQLRRKHEFCTPFFAFDRNNGERQAHQLFPTLAMHLAHRYKEYHDELCRRDIDELSTRDLTDQCETLMVSALGNCTATPPIVFVIDALDECPPSSATGKRNTLLKELCRCMADESLPFNIRFLITCRYDDTDIRGYLPLGEPSLRMMSMDNVAGTDGDIRLYVEHELTGSGPVGLIDDVVEAAQTLFECAAVLCRELKKVDDPADATPPARLISEVMRAPGKRLYATYRLILQSHFKNPRTRDLYRRILTWVLLVQSPQPRGVFSDIARVLLDDSIDSVLNGLSSLLTGTFGDNASVVQPLHTSFRDFVLDANDSKEFAVVLGPEAHRDLADACFRIMTDAAHC
ncbi:hypothetical protein BD626DRAFT_635519 [Schizophyllum amplum]|uniref:Nephrocystin 3-like N-terminal domain-containing protein n=1 Tax=Schizophyllum amplum TaxID=97359 RepID=A0A550BVY7_9AGAR|nr:hypothetical protein BD626DRAFT_635519 [Auriculariopsis ampla]